MIENRIKIFFIVFAINLTIAIGFYISNLNANYSDLSSDIQNIIPVAQKFDNPELFKYDLYLNDINNVRYYTPFYVQSLRFLAKFTNHNYLQAINVMNLISHLLFGVLWFFLIYKFVSNFWIALLVSILIRGIVWLPGFEIWGIASLWTMMPRTLYITLFPIPFIILSTSSFKLILASFLIGLVFNFHPITGLGGILLFLSFITLYAFYFNEKNSLNIKNIVLIFMALLLGMSPFLKTYFLGTSAVINYDINAFNEAFDARIPAFFLNPLLFLKQWLGVKTLLYIIPIILFYVFLRQDKKKNEHSKIIVILTLILIILPSVSAYVERLINLTFGLNLRLSFQLIRMQKVAIIPSFFAMAYLFQMMHDKYKNKMLLPVVTSVFIFILVLSKHSVFNSIPFIGDDIARHILPNNLSLGQVLPNTKLNIDKMSEYIAKNTEQDAIIYGNHIYRSASKRSVLLDSKGASMVIEGNPVRFIEWKQQQKRLAAAKSPAKQVEVLTSLNVNYMATRRTDFNLEVIHKEGDLILYKLQ